MIQSTRMIIILALTSCSPWTPRGRNAILTQKEMLMWFINCCVIVANSGDIIAFVWLLQRPVLVPKTVIVRCSDMSSKLTSFPRVSIPSSMKGHWRDHTPPFVWHPPIVPTHASFCTAALLVMKIKIKIYGQYCHNSLRELFIELNVAIYPFTNEGM